jgi:hypothetical protein
MPPSVAAVNRSAAIPGAIQSRAVEAGAFAGGLGGGGEWSGLGVWQLVAGAQVVAAMQADDRVGL